MTATKQAFEGDRDRDRARENTKSPKTKCALIHPEKVAEKIR